MDSSERDSTPPSDASDSSTHSAQDSLSNISTEALVEQAASCIKRLAELKRYAEVHGPALSDAQMQTLSDDIHWLKRATDELERRGVLEQEDAQSTAPPREPWQWPAWLSFRNLLRGGVALGVVALGVIAVYAVNEYMQPSPPIFRRFEKLPALPELMAQPPTYNYGSSIHFWTYHQPDGTLAEVAVTGHADSRTCKKISGLLFNTYLEKQLEREDLIVAGSSWFKLREDPKQRAELAQNPQVLEYLQVRETYNLGKAALSMASVVPVESKSKVRSTVEDLEADLKKIMEQKAALEKDSAVERYLQNSKSGESLGVLIKEAQRIGQASGLVYFHRVPMDVAETVRLRIADAAKAQKPTTLTFDDLLTKVDGHEAVVLTEQVKTGSGEPIEISLPMAEFLVDSFEEAKRESHSAIERAMIGDAQDREEFYQRERRKYDEQRDNCRRMSPYELLREIALDQTCSNDGICRKSKNPRRITNKDYCDIQIPHNIKLVNEWSESIQPLLTSIRADAAKKGEGKIDALDLAVLGESMLRNWALPVSDSQSAFDAWRQKQRTPIWRELLKRLARQGVRADVIGGENMIFNVRRQGENLVVRPVHIIDLARAVVVVDPRLGGTRLVDAWNERKVIETVTIGATIPSPDTFLAPLPKGTAGSAGFDALRTFLSFEPSEGVKRLELLWRNFFPNDEKRLDELVARNQNALEASEILTAVDELRNSPATKEQPLLHERRLRDLLKTHKNAPADYHLMLARDLAMAILAAELAEGGSTHSEPSNSAVWAVVKTYANAEVLNNASQLFEKWNAENGQHDSEESANQRLGALIKVLGRSEVFGVSDPYRRGRVIVSAFLSEDAAVVIRESIAEAMKRDPIYVAKAHRQEELPKEGSIGLNAMLDSTRATHSEGELEAFQLSRMRELLRYRSVAELAAMRLWGVDVPDYAKVLDILRPAVAASAVNAALELTGPFERLKSRLESDRAPDTLTRRELAGNIMYGADRLLLRSRHLLDEYPDLLSVWRDYRAIAARIHFENGDYQKAIETLFSEDVPVALYAPELRVTLLNEKKEGRLGDLRIRRAEGLLTVGVLERDAITDVLRLEGLSSPVAAALEQHLSANLSRQSAQHGRLAERVLGLRVPLASGAQAFRTLIMDPKARPFLLKAMVYGCAPPASYLVSNEGHCDDSTPGGRKRDRILQGVSVTVSVPTLSDVKTLAERSMMP